MMVVVVVMMIVMVIISVMIAAFDMFVLMNHNCTMHIAQRIEASLVYNLSTGIIDGYLEDVSCSLTRIVPDIYLNNKAIFNTEPSA